MSGSAIGSGLMKWRVDKLTTAHIIADALFHAVARIALEDAEVLTLVAEIVRDAAEGERNVDEPRTAAMLSDIANHVENIRDEPVVDWMTRMGK